MKTRPLGRTGLRVSEVGFGAWAIGGHLYEPAYGPTEDAVSLAAIRRALELGCTFFDTADVYGYGHSEELLGQALKDRPDVVIATKVGGNFYGPTPVDDFSPSYIRFAFDQSRRRLQRDVLDVYLLHSPPLAVIRQPQTYEVLLELKARGLIRAWGVSALSAEDALMALESGQPDVLEVTYNLFRQEPAEELFPAAQAAGVGIIAREPLANGFLSGKYGPESIFPPGDIRADFPRSYIEAATRAAEECRVLVLPGRRTLTQAAIRFALEHEAVSVVIPGIKTPEQAEENLAASDVPPLTPDELRWIATHRWHWTGL